MRDSAEWMTIKIPSDRNGRRENCKVIITHAWSDEHGTDIAGVSGRALIEPPRLILVSAADDRHSQDDTLLHEILHHCWPKDVTTEEGIIRKLTPRLLVALRSVGFRFPDQPSEVKTLCRAVRRKYASLDGD